MPVLQEIWVRSLGWEDPLENRKATHSSILACKIPYSALSSHSLEKEMATLSSILAWKIPWTEEPGGPYSMGLQRIRDK